CQRMPPVIKSTGFIRTSCRPPPSAQPVEHLNPTRRPDADAEPLLHALPAGAAHLLPQPRVIHRPADGLDPFTRRFHKEAVVAGSDQFALNPHWVGHYRQPGRHVLEDLEPALAPAPKIVRQVADADVGRRDVGRFGDSIPWTVNHPQGVEPQETVT